MRPDGRPWLTSEDAAKRFESSLALHYLALSVEELIAKRFVAVALADGSSDNTAYETRAEAVRHQTTGDANQYMYLCIPMARPGLVDCDGLLWYARRCYDAGYRPATSHEGAGLILPLRQEHITTKDFLLYDADGSAHQW